MGSAHLPVFDLGELELLDTGETLAGYRAGSRGEPEPGPECSRAYHHGWRVGSFDAGYRAIDTAHEYLVAQYRRAQSTIH